ncbi:MAG: hypothetical protein ACRDUV_22425 [Pseudonocardiaceae bacterium]
MSATMAILDGHTVEPSGLGVPPYLSTYVREAYSALRKAYPSADVRYLTIDDVTVSTMCAAADRSTLPGCSTL